MKRSRFTEEQIIGVLREQEAGMKIAEVCRKHGLSEPTFYAWKARFGGTPVRRRLRSGCHCARLPQALLCAGSADGLRPGLTQAARDGADEDGRDGETPLDRAKKHRHDVRNQGPISKWEERGQVNPQHE